MGRKQDFLKSRKAIGGFAVIAIISAFFFLQGPMTGNVILEDSAQFNFVSVIGILLVFCAFVLAFYFFRKK